MGTSIAPSGMTFLYSDIYRMEGQLFVGLSFEYLERVVLKKYSGATRKSTCRYRSGTKRGEAQTATFTLE